MFKYQTFILIILLINFNACINRYVVPTPQVNHLFDKSYTHKSLELHKKNNRNYIPSSDSHNNVLYFLDMGMLNFYSGDGITSNQLLSQAGMAIEKNFTKSISQYASSFIMDDRILNYNGEAYEDIYLNVFKALNYFQLNNVDAAGVELRRVNEKMRNLQDKYAKMAQKISQDAQIRSARLKIKTERINFYNSALSRYLSSIYYQFEQQYDDARIDIQHAYAAFSQQKMIYNFEKPRHLSIMYQCLSRHGDACFKTKKESVYLVAFAGRAPEKKAKTYWIISKKNYIIIAKTKNGSGRIEAIPFPGAKAGLFFQFSFPYMQKRQNNVKKIVAFIGQKSVQMEKLEDMANVAIETFNLKQKLIYLKTIVRATAKGLIAANIKKKMGKNKKKLKKQKKINFLGNLLIDAAISATEKADLRLSSFFPAAAYSGILSVRPGTYRVKIIYYNSRNKPIKVQNLGKQRITKNGLNLIQSSYYGIY